MNFVAVTGRLDGTLPLGMGGIGMVEIYREVAGTGCGAAGAGSG